MKLHPDALFWHPSRGQKVLVQIWLGISGADANSDCFEIEGLLPSNSLLFIIFHQDKNPDLVRNEWRFIAGVYYYYYYGGVIDQRVLSMSYTGSVLFHNRSAFVSSPVLLLFTKFN